MHKYGNWIEMDVTQNESPNNIWMIGNSPPGNSAGDWGCLRWPNIKGCWWPLSMEKERSRLESPGRNLFIWVFPKIGVPQNGWFTMENPIKMDDLGCKNHYFWKHPYPSFLQFQPRFQARLQSLYRAFYGGFWYPGIEKKDTCEKTQICDICSKGKSTMRFWRVVSTCCTDLYY